MEATTTVRRYQTRKDIWVHLLLYPGHTLPTAAAPILLGMGLAARDRVFAFWPAMAAFLASWLVHCGGVFNDNYQLLTRHPGLMEHPELEDSVRDGSLDLRVLRVFTWGWFLAALLPGIYLYRLLGPPALLLGVAGILGSSWYASPGKLAMARLGLADPVFYGMFVFAVVATYYVQAVATGAAVTFSPEALLLALPMAGVVVNVLLIDDLRDIEFDRAKGWRTTPIRFGVKGSLREHLFWTLFGSLSPLGFAFLFGPWMLLPLLTVPGFILAEKKIRRAKRREELIPWTPISAFLSLVYAALLALGLVLSR